MAEISRIGADVLVDNTLSNLAVLDLLRQAILSGELKPGDRLVESALAQKYMVSRTPIREAIKHLSALNLVRIEKYKGAVVADIDTEEWGEMLVVRAALEGLATALAAEHMDTLDLTNLELYLEKMSLAAEEKNIKVFSEYNEYFHQLINQKSRNAFLQTSIETILKRAWHMRAATWKRIGNPQQIIDEHREILDALKAHDRKAAREVAEIHVLNALIRTRKKL